MSLRGMDTGAIVVLSAVRFYAPTMGDIDDLRNRINAAGGAV